MSLFLFFFFFFNVGASKRYLHGDEGRGDAQLGGGGGARGQGSRLPPRAEDAEDAVSLHQQGRVDQREGQAEAHVRQAAAGSSGCGEEREDEQVGADETAQHDPAQLATGGTNHALTSVQAEGDGRHGGHHEPDHRGHLQDQGHGRVGGGRGHLDGLAASSAALVRPLEGRAGQAPGRVGRGDLVGLARDARPAARLPGEGVDLPLAARLGAHGARRPPRLLPREASALHVQSVVAVLPHPDGDAADPAAGPLLALPDLDGAHHVPLLVELERAARAVEPHAPQVRLQRVTPHAGSGPATSRLGTVLA